MQIVQQAKRTAWQLFSTQGLLACISLLLSMVQPAVATYGAFAECVKRSGAVLYSASWCPHCQKQLQGFRGYANRLNWVERYPSGHDFLARRCKDKRIKSFPTWILGDGTVRAQFLQHDELAKLTDCPKP